MSYMHGEKTIENIQSLRPVKNVLDEQAFKGLQAKLFSDCREITTRYDYFDTSANDQMAKLYQRGIRLRVKVRDGFTFQYKRTGEVPEEIKQPITEAEYSQLMNSH